MWFVLAQDALKTAFVLGTNEDPLTKANHNHQCGNIFDVIVIVVGHISTMRETHTAFSFITIFQVRGPASNADETLTH